jgi:putative ABC transport system substrate-binding protein
MRRRDFILFLGGTAAGWPLSAHAQSPRTVGVLMNGSASETFVQANVSALKAGLHDLNWVEGKNLRMVVRWNGGSAENARLHAAELAKLAPNVIVSASTTNLRALRGATRSIPIVFLQVSDPIAQGFVTSLTKPDGNITGFSAFEFAIGGKWLELLKEIAPRVTRIGVMFNPDTSPQSRFFMRAIEAAAPSFGVEIAAAPVGDSADIERAVERYTQPANGGIILPTDSFTRLREKRIAELAIQHRVPVIGAAGNFVDQGGLMFYGPTAGDHLAAQYRQAAGYVNRILKGAKPADLPIQLASKFSLFINRRTAAAIGLEIPPRLLFTAERVIE